MLLLISSWYIYKIHIIEQGTVIEISFPKEMSLPLWIPSSKCLHWLNVLLVTNHKSRILIVQIESPKTRLAVRSKFEITFIKIPIYFIIKFNRWKYYCFKKKLSRFEFWSMDVDFSESLNDTLTKLPNKSLFHIQIKSKARLIELVGTFFFWGWNWLVLGRQYNIICRTVQRLSMIHSIRLTRETIDKIWQNYKWKFWWEHEFCRILIIYKHYLLFLLGFYKHYLKQTSPIK